MASHIAKSLTQPGAAIHDCFILEPLPHQWWSHYQWIRPIHAISGIMEGRSGKQACVQISHHVPTHMSSAHAGLHGLLSSRFLSSSRPPTPRVPVVHIITACTGSCRRLRHVCQDSTTCLPIMLVSPCVWDVTLRLVACLKPEVERWSKQQLERKPQAHQHLL